jgi:rfaE bifunctional protein nucleotidyltransferase chain/domain
VHGVFDLLHPGHVRLLEQARSLGNLLVVAVHRDGKNTPAVAGARDRQSISERNLTPAAERAEIVAALAAVDFVAEMDPSGIVEFVERLKPDVLVKGSTSNENIPLEEEIHAEEIVKKAAGTVIVIPLEPGFSKSGLMERIRQAGA